MLLFNVQALDLFVYDTTKAYTDLSLASVLGAAETLNVQVTVTESSGTGKFNLDVDHSSDGVNWINAGSVANQPINPGAVNSFLYTFSGPFAALVRVAVYLGLAGDSANIKLNISGRAQLPVAQSKCSSRWLPP